MSVFSHPLEVQSSRDRSTLADKGQVVMAQAFGTIIVSGAAAVSVTLFLPRNARIHGFTICNDVVWNAGTSSTLTVGTAAAGTQYLTAVNVQSAAGLIPLTATHVTGTQSANWLSVGNNTTIVATITPAGTTPTTGTTNVTVLYSVASV